jgi:EAL domain-containing protein (putative c-di-GMP-specific phosphodiesterase class I)
MGTCAEGVETKEQLMFLRNEGCNEVQGYFYSKPRPASDITRMLHGAGVPSGEKTQSNGVDRAAVFASPAP